ncbi:MAG: ATP-dependent helicase HrpB [Gemmatimonadetes bacterium]|nr:ATP-dependent helicase HrpB [Gemmatimonadota bacterium]
MRLPIEAILEEVSAALTSRGLAVLTAPPGAGKTTGVPPALLDQTWLEHRRIVMLEPRRLAARAAASRMASLRTEPVGRTIGYRIRLDTRVSEDTRIEVVTEGVLTRMLQTDPSLDGIGLVIFDEFHERSLHADLGLALCLEARALLRPDLRILLMSATLEVERIATLLDGAPMIESGGLAFPVETHYLDRPRDNSVDAAVVSAVRRALEAHHGDILAFLPGGAEIRRAADRLANLAASAIAVLPLYGDLSHAEQDRAIAPSPPGRRKVVLSTALAETSLTIEGVRIVIDSGLMRVPRFSPRTGLTRLETVPVSRASADQRRGRAGRTGPGHCYRLWTRGEDAGLVDRNLPEILAADLVPLALELATWGTSDPAALRWLDAPPAAAFAQARELLAGLGALDAAGAVTAHGRRMADLPVHPRLAHMLLLAEERGALHAAASLAALLGERDILQRSDAPIDPDIRTRLDLLRDSRSTAGSAQRVHRDTVGRVRAEAGRLARMVRTRNARTGSEAGIPGSDEPRRKLPQHPAEPRDSRAHDADPHDDAGWLLALAYPDRIARRRTGEPGRFLLRNGRGARIDAAFALASEPFITAAVLDGRGREARVFLAAPLDEAALEELFADQIVLESSVAWDAAARRVSAVRRRRLGAIVLHEATLADGDPDAIADVLVRGILESGIDALPWTPAARAIQQRIRFLHRLDAAWPDVSDAALAGDGGWLRSRTAGMTSLDEVRFIDLAALLLDRLDHRQRADLDRLAPTHIAVPSGSRIAIDYQDPDAPALAVRLQEVFGLVETPRIAGGRVPVVMHLLSPAQRPVQVTRDLASFWRTTYFDVRKDLRGRYPRHHWPDDPLTAPPTRGPKRR